MTVHAGWVLAVALVGLFVGFMFGGHAGFDLGQRHEQAHVAFMAACAPKLSEPQCAALWAGGVREWPSP